MGPVDEIVNTTTEQLSISPAIAIKDPIQDWPGLVSEESTERSAERRATLSDALIIAALISVVLIALCFLRIQ
jgi:hypothetical protein